jgi:hypothetical protein
MVKGMKILGTLKVHSKKKKRKCCGDLNLTNPIITDRYVMQMFY